MGERWTAHQYGSVWDDLYRMCDQNTQEVLDRRLDILLEQGSLTRRPIVAPLRDGLFELRAKQARAIFFFRPGRKIIFVHGLIKKQPAIAPKDIKMAKNRMEQILREEGKNDQYHHFSN